MKEGFNRKGMLLMTSPKFFYKIREEDDLGFRKDFINEYTFGRKRIKNIWGKNII